MGDVEGGGDRDVSIGGAAVDQCRTVAGNRIGIDIRALCAVADIDLDEAVEATGSFGEGDLGSGQKDLTKIVFYNRLLRDLRFGGGITIDQEAEFFEPPELPSNFWFAVTEVVLAREL